MLLLKMNYIFTKVSADLAEVEFVVAWVYNFQTQTIPQCIVRSKNQNSGSDNDMHSELSEESV